MREAFPQSAYLYEGSGAEPRRELQRRDDCQTFGWTSALEALAARAGQAQQFSAGYLWLFRDDQAGNTPQTYAALINRIGLIPDALYSYEQALRNDLPNSAAWAGRVRVKVSTKLIAGFAAVMRAISTGHSIVTIRLIGGGVDHCECVIGYDKDKGFLVHGSGNDVTWWAWDTIDQFTQMHAVTADLWPCKPFDGYREADAATFEAGVLRLPEVTVRWPMLKPSVSATGVTMHFTKDDYVVTWDDEECQPECTYNASSDVLHMPRLELVIDGIRMPYRNVILTGAGLEQQ